MIVVVVDDDDDCCCNYLDDSMSWKMVKVSYYVQVLAIKMLWRRQQLISLQWQFPGSLPSIGCLQKNKDYQYVHIIYVWSLWSPYCDWIKNLTPSGVFVLEAIPHRVLNMLNQFAQTQDITIGWRWTHIIFIYIYIHICIYVVIRYCYIILLFTLHDHIHNHAHIPLRYVIYLHTRMNYFPHYQLLLSPPPK